MSQCRISCTILANLIISLLPAWSPIPRPMTKTCLVGTSHTIIKHCVKQSLVSLLILCCSTDDWNGSHYDAALGWFAVEHSPSFCDCFQSVHLTGSSPCLHLKPSRLSCVKDNLYMHIIVTRGVFLLLDSTHSGHMHIITKLLANKQLIGNWLLAYHLRSLFLTKLLRMRCIHADSHSLLSTSSNRINPLAVQSDICFIHGILTFDLQLIRYLRCCMFLFIHNLNVFVVDAAYGDDACAWLL